MRRKGSFLNPSLQAEKHFLPGFQRKATVWTFQEEKQITCDAAQARSCHKASERSGASRGWWKRRKLYSSLAFKKDANLSASVLQWKTIWFRGVMFNKMVLNLSPWKSHIQDKTSVSWTGGPVSSPWIATNGYERAGSFHSSGPLGKLLANTH